MIRVVPTEFKELVKEAIALADHLSGEVDYLRIYNEGSIVEILTHHRGSLYVYQNIISTEEPEVELNEWLDMVSECIDCHCHEGCGCGCWQDLGFQDSTATPEIHKSCRS